ncbi:Transcription termination factor Rho [Actinomyces bovis]|uniref:Transcription termination factor Rho n=1 Tax=Actinomyces bovis TaxID=1658 RepID=A0ABY1VQR7_9ACTO|nr:transcription termination factor Rho [Actinomyces bovis]SPT53398.1 Transcription termination factor Rho [Actinomyces bovis]VEG52813.1 Transcription termination factor Rho [Actinomyces israelii]
MTETSANTASLTTMRLADLQALAASMGLKGTSRMRKSDLVAAIKNAHGGAPKSETAPSVEAPTLTEPTPIAEPSANAAPAVEAPAEAVTAGRGRRRRVTAAAGAPTAAPLLELPEPRAEREVSEEDASRAERRQRGERPDHSERLERNEWNERGERRQRGEDGQGSRQEGSRRSRRRAQIEAAEEGGVDHQDAKAALMRDLADVTGTPVVEHSESRQNQQRDDWDEDGRSGRRRRGRRRGREDRQNGQNGHNNNQNGGNQNNQDGGQRAPREDEVLLPVAGILDASDSNHAYLRTSGYLPGPKDVYVSQQQIKNYGLRPGDAITGWVREGGESDQPQRNAGRQGRRNRPFQRVKYNPLASVDTVNGMDPERSKRRPDFTKLTPLYPQEQLRLETTPKALTPRIIDLVSPIGKGQRGLIVSPPKAGKTIVLQQIANAIAINNPEVHLMVVLVDERPEEVTDMQRTVKGEVIASTFDRPASDHTTVAELAIERAKRLVELGQDVVVLLDSITRLGRAYNLAAPVSGRILSGGVDAAALYPPKRFFGAARNIENGGSLTILATALVETGSKMDEVIFEEFKGTGNMELRLSRQLAEKRLFPAVDVAASSTRREEFLIDPAQLKIMWRLRRLFTGLEQQQALELVLGKLKETNSNAEFLMVISKTTPQGTSLADADD